jgi:hypothetical protein
MDVRDDCGASLAAWACGDSGTGGVFVVPGAWRLLPVACCLLPLWRRVPLMRLMPLGAFLPQATWASRAIGMTREELLLQLTPCAAAQACRASSKT